MRVCLIAAALCLALVRPAHADPPSELLFRGFGSEQGLDGLSIDRIAQTEDGLLWLASEDGLYAYDGTRFTRQGVGEGLPADEITALLAVGNTLWVGTSMGLARIDRRTAGRVWNAPAEGINALARGADGSIWIATSAGLYRQLLGFRTLAPGWTAGESTAVAVLRDGGIVAAAGTSVLVSSAEGWRALPLTLPEAVDDLVVLGDGSLWGRSERALWTCEPSLARCRDVSDEAPTPSERGRLYVDRAGTLWVTMAIGVAHRLADGHWETLGHADGLPARSVLAMFEDREGSLWFAADELYLLLGRQRWRGYTVRSGVPGDTIWAVLRDRDGLLWLGTNRGLARAAGDGWETVDGAQGSSIKAILDGGDVLYVAGGQGDVLAVDRATRAVQRLGPGIGGIQSLARHEGALYVATWESGLVRSVGDLAHPRWEHVTLPDGDAHEPILQIAEDRAQRLWVAGARGLAVLDHGTWHRFTEADGLAARSVAFLVARRSGEVCFAYREAHGISCARYADGQLHAVHHLTHRDGLTNDKVYTLGEDLDGRLYVGLGVGVDLVAPMQIEHVSSTSGVVGDDCAARAFWVDPDGTVFLGTSRGLARFDSKGYVTPPVPPAPNVMELELGGPRSARALTVRIATATFANRARLEQEVRLVPFESTWRPIGGDPTRYPRVPPGHYTLQARARFAPGAYGPTTSVEIDVEPVWWQTVWFRAALVLLALAGAGAAFSWRARVVAARARLREAARSEASFRALIEHSPEAVFIHRGGTFMYANARTVTLLGYASARELIGASVFDRVHADDRAVAQERARGLLETGDATPSRETRMLRRDGSLVIVEASALRLEIDGTPAVVVFARDCTERRAFESRLMFADRMASLGTLAAGLAHEVNNPLAYLKANLAVATEESELATPSADVIRTALSDALEGANRVQAIVQSVKAFSRVDSEQRTTIDVHQALELALRMTSNELKHRCRVVKELGPVPFVLGSESRLGQVFMNLLVNAAQALPRDHGGHEITVHTATNADGNAVIEIRDTGCGMTPDVQRRIFEPFFTTKDIGEGTGLGLSVCHGIIKSMGGDISVESTLGAGSTFRVVLPATRRAAAMPKPSSVAMAPVKRSVLLIDDDEKLLGSIARMLRREHEVALATSATRALELIASGVHFDVIVCDLMMPHFTGMDLHAHLVAARPEIVARMLFMTGGAFTPEARQFLDRPSIRSIEKPFDAGELRRRIQSIARAAVELSSCTPGPYPWSSADSG